jgi:alpha-L-rhamnosidase
MCTLAVMAGVGRAAVENVPTGLMCELMEHPERTVITDPQPDFGWVVNSPAKNELQSAYQILVASTAAKLKTDTGDLWDSGRVVSSQSVAVEYDGSPLQAGTSYWWKVRTFLKSGTPSRWSEPQRINRHQPKKSGSTAKGPLVDALPDRYLPVREQRKPVKFLKVADGHAYFDFGKAAFGTVILKINSPGAANLQVHLGEERTPDGERVNRKPGGTRRYRMMTVPVTKGQGSYTVKITPDKRNTGGAAIKMPASVGEVMPFRYCEISNCPAVMDIDSVTMVAVNYPFDDEAASFTCSDETLNAVWEMSKYSIKATSFCGVYVDGDRERIPYEADAYINQLCHYGTDREYTLARYSHEYLIMHPTWPTEWAHHSVLMAWADYEYTGDKESMARYYNDLKAKTLHELARADGLISTRNIPKEVFKKIHIGRLRDIVDWPKGERDGYDFKAINTVVNVFHYRTCVLFAQMAKALGEHADAAEFEKKATQVGAMINEKLFDAKRGIYIDGEGSQHASLHANMWPLAFGLVPADRVAGVAKFVKSRKMGCSVYGAQYLLDALYLAGEDDYALSLMNSKGKRSWWNMIREGSTISMEAWGNQFKSNQDWNHAWGAVPANIIPRRLMGVTPLEPGFGRIQIKPRVGSLRSGSLKTPTIRGPVYVAFNQKPGKSFSLTVRIPANTTADVYVPIRGGNDIVNIDGKRVKGKVDGKFIRVAEVGSGEHRIQTSTR